jgi:SAM-dependent methyltransferase
MTKKIVSKAKSMQAAPSIQEAVPLKIDLGSGRNKREGFLGIDRRQFPEVDQVVDLMGKWPWDDNSVDEANMSHSLEHFSGMERIHIFNELYRVLKPGSKCSIVVPSWSSGRAYGDPTHKWPPVSEMAFNYLSKEWRRTQAPDTDIEWNPEGFSCDFDIVGGYGMHQQVMSWNQERQMFAITFYKEAAQDIHMSITKRA